MEIDITFKMDFFVSHSPSGITTIPPPALLALAIALLIASDVFSLLPLIAPKSVIENSLQLLKSGIFIAGISNGAFTTTSV